MNSYLKHYLSLSIFLVLSIQIFPQESGNDTETYSWHHKDFIKDSIPGLSTEFAIKSYAKQSTNPVVVAIIDSPVDLSHPDLKDAIWINEKEIPFNGVDDDKNGYIDDIHGWNFLGYGQSKMVLDGTYGHINQMQLLKHKKLNTSLTVTEDSLLIKTKILQTEKREELLRDIQRDSTIFYNYRWLRKTYPQLFSNDDDYKEEKLDSLMVVDTLFSEKFASLRYLTYGQIGVDAVKESYFENLDKLYSYNNENNEIWKKADSLWFDPERKSNGTPYVGQHFGILTHGTQIATTIAAKRGNLIGTRGFSNDIRIMVLATTNNAGIRDKDFYNAVRYAVDNGAKIINFSFGKDYPEQPELYEKAIRYAENKGVLFICASGNSSLNLDDSKNRFWPNKAQFGNKVPNNFLKVSSSTEYTGEWIAANYGNYGLSEVDFYAPGSYIDVGNSKELYVWERSGTSLASATTSGAAALVLSYFPELTAAELSKILKSAVVQYNYVVEIAGKEMEFSNLSSQGGILNVKLALDFANKLAKEK